MYSFATVVKQLGRLDGDGESPNFVLILPFSLHIPSEVLQDV